MLTIIVPIFLSEIESNNVYEIVPKDRDFDVIFLNNNTDINLDWAVNNPYNGGKFWSVLNNINKIKTKYFLSIDPDDIICKSIDWEVLDELCDSVSKVAEFNLGINDYLEIREEPNESYIVKNNHYNKVFNACCIYNTKIIKNTFNDSGVVWDGLEQTYYEDFLFAIASSFGGDVEFFSLPFYGYHHRKGISKDWRKYKHQIVSANSKLEKLLKNNSIDSINDRIKDRIININIKRIQDRSK